MARRYLLLVTTLIAASVAATAPACSSSTQDTAIDLLPDDAGIRGLVGLTVTPASTSLAIVPGATAAMTLVATGKFDDGGLRDVTRYVSWSAGTSAADVIEGRFSTTNGGIYTVTATSGTQRASATVRVMLSGPIFEAGFDPAKKGALDGAPSAAVAPTVVYPLAGTLFPANVAPVDVQLRRGAAAQTLARVALKVDGALDVLVYTKCEPIAGAADGCSVILSSKLCTMIAEANETGPLVAAVRLAAPDGASTGEAALGAEWTRSRLGGGLYYWTTIRMPTGDKTAIKRFDLDKSPFAPETYWTNDDSPSLASGEAKPCAGCHAVSRDGKKLALTFGGSDASSFELVDVAKKSAIALRNTDTKGFATMTTFSPDGARLVNSFRGQLTLRTADDKLTALGTLFADTTDEAKTHPFWSPNGKSFAFVSWQPGKNGASDSTNGDIERGGQIWIGPSDGSAMTGKATLLVPREPGKTLYYPAISDDGSLVAFNRSSCDGPARTAGYGPDACDGYDDASARIALVLASGGPSVDLAKVNGTDTWSSSWPRFSPDHGTFQGKPIYWIAYSARRPYGLRIAGSTKGESSPQLWFAAISVETGKPIGLEPAYAPFWLPAQNVDDKTPTGNHVPQWAAVAVPRVK